MFIPQVVEAAELPQLEVIDINQVIKDAAAKWHVNYTHLYKTLSCESEGFKDVTLQSEVLDSNGPNGREDSWGIAQIWLDPKGHPEVSKEEAMDPTFAANFAAQLFSEGQEHQFHCYNIEEKNGWR